MIFHDETFNVTEYNTVVHRSYQLAVANRSHLSPLIQLPGRSGAANPANAKSEKDVVFLMEMLKVP